MRKTLSFFLFLFLIVISTRNVSGAFSFTISGINPTSVSSKEDEVEVTLSITELPSESYFRVAWQESSGQPYFGYIKNEAGTWVKVEALSADCTNYYHVTDTSMTSLVLKTKIGSENDISGGLYNLKAHRFTTSCTETTGLDSFGIEVNLPTPTPTPTPSSTTSPTPSPTSSTSPTSEPTVKATATSKPTTTPKPTINSDQEDNDEVLGLRDGLIPSPTPEVEKKSEAKLPFVAGLFLFLGTGLMGFAGYSVYKKNGGKIKIRIKKKVKKDNGGFSKIEMKQDDI